MNPSRFIALHCGEEAQTLLSDHPNAFLLLLQIAMRAKWKDCPITGLKAGQAFIGDWKKAGLRSRKVYQVAMERLEKGKLAVFQGGNRGTLATLTGSTIFSITKDAKGHPEGKLGDNKGTPEGHLGDTNHTDTLITQSTMSTKHTHNKATIEELKAFCAEIGLPATDGEFMFHKWESNGWTNKGGPVLNWKAQIRSWKSAKYLPSQSSRNPNKPTSAYEFGAL